MTDYRLDIRIRNNRILSTMREMGYENVNQFCKATGFNICTVGELVNLRRSPLTKTGEWAPLARRLSNALCAEPDDLWTIEQRFMSLESNRRCYEVDESEAMALISEHPSPEELIDRTKMSEALDGQLSRLTDREKDVIQRRFYEDHTLDEVAEHLEVSRERVHQIEAKALRRLRYGGKTQGNQLYRIYEPDSEFCKKCGNLLKGEAGLLSGHGEDEFRGAVRFCLKPRQQAHNPRLEQAVHLRQFVRTRS